MKSLSAIFLLTFPGQFLYAQQLPQYSLWLINPFGTNPACAGLEPSLVANAVYRNQWVDFEGAPETQQVNAHLPINQFSSGAGLRIETDGIGAHRTTQAVAAYNYQWQTNSGAVLSIGLGAGYQQYTLDGNKLRTPQGDYRDQQFQHNDDYLPLGRISVGAPVVELGLALTTAKWQIAISSMPVFAPSLRERSPGRFALQPRRHYVAQGNYQFPVGEWLRLRPGALLKSDGTAFQAELGMLGFWKDKILGGLSYRGFTARTRDAVVMMGGVAVNDRTMLCYAFDLPISGLQNTNRGSHELQLRYTLNQPIGTGKLPPTIYNPRYRSSGN